MKFLNRLRNLAATAVLVFCAPTLGLADPLPSWNDGETKTAIVDFVEKVTRKGSSDFVEVNQRIATFDNDGNLWAEQPAYFQLIYALDQVKKMASQHPEWKTQEPFASVGNSDGDYQILEWATAGSGPRFGLLLHHTDAKGEWAYDRKSHIGQLNKALDDASKKGWTVIDMKSDWNKVFPFDQP